MRPRKILRGLFCPPISKFLKFLKLLNFLNIPKFLIPPLTPPKKITFYFRVMSEIATFGVISVESRKQND